MKNAIYTLLLFFATVTCQASTPVYGPYVISHWTLAGSPYLVYTDITIPNSGFLIIDPGVQVVFQGYYRIYAEGSLMARGTAAQPITFTVQDTTGWSNTAYGNTQGSWKGVQFPTHPYPAWVDTSELRHCNFEHMKNSGVFVGRNIQPITNCSFKHNMVPMGGAGNVLRTHSTDSNVRFEIKDCMFSQNVLYGGDIIGANTQTGATKGRLNIENCTISDNEVSVYGGVILAAGLNLTLKNNTISKNGSVATGGASTIIMTDGCTAIIEGNRIYENVCDYVSSLSCYITKLDLNRNYICNNHTISGYDGTGEACFGGQGGGGVRISNMGDTTHALKCTVTNNIFANNYAGLGGGALYIYYAETDVVNNHFVNNRGEMGGGIFVGNGASSIIPVNIKNNLFYNNCGSALTPEKYNVWIRHANEVAYSYNRTQWAFADDVKVDFGTPDYTDTTNNVRGDSPDMVSPTIAADYTESALTANFNLLPSSGCVNTGDNAAVGTTYDFANNARIYGTRVDIGALEGNAATLTVADANTTKLLVYPNPSTGMLYIATPVASGTVFIKDIAGRVIQETKVAGNITLLHLQSAKGIYFAVWADERGSEHTQKLLLD